MSLLQRPAAAKPVSWRWVEGDGTSGLLEINGTLYGVKAIPGGFEVRKAGSEEPHHVGTETEPWSCTCGDHVWRGRKCKHILTIRAAMLEQTAAAR